MLQQLTIENLALVDKLDINFGSGFNVITGETGAGKSIILDAINLLTGYRADNDLIRNGTDKARVDGLFLLSPPEKLLEVFANLGLEWEEDDSLLLSRELSRQGKNLCRINGRTVTLSMYKLVGEELVVIYGQHHQQMLTGRDYHLELLEGFAQEDYHQLKEAFSLVYKEKKTYEKNLRAMVENQKNRLQEGDMLTFQLKEIEEANLSCDEEEELEAEYGRINNIEKIVKLAGDGYGLLNDEGHNNKSILLLLGQALKKIEDLSALDGQVEPLVEMLSNSYYQLDEVIRGLADYIQGITFSPNRLEEIQERRNLIKQLKRKYGATIKDVLIYKETISERLELLTNYEENLQELEQKVQKLNLELQELAEVLRERRKDLAALLEKRVTDELSVLSMPQVRFKVDFQTLDPLREDGGDLIEFLLSANPGEDLKPLAKIASGGEISRIMLALIISLAPQPWKTLIFDEIDTGLGGHVAVKVGEKLKSLAKAHQLFSVTHSPQVAALADQHYFVKKEIFEGRSFTQIKRLDYNGRVEEISRMLGTNEDSTTALQLAEELITKK